jgi:hypothetical protein
MRYLIVLACLLIAAADALATEVTFPGAVADGYPKIAQVTGYLVFPTGEAKEQVPAVVILHGSGGIDGRGKFHAKALNAAGIATLEVFMFTSGNRPRGGSRSNFTHMLRLMRLTQVRCRRCHPELTGLFVVIRPTICRQKFRHIL